MRGSERLCCESFKDDGSKVDLKAGQSDEDEHDRQVRLQSLAEETVPA